MGEENFGEWKYTGPIFGEGKQAVQPFNVKGRNGRVSITPRDGRFLVDMGGASWDVPRPLAEEIRNALSTALANHAGSSIIEHIMAELDIVVDRLMTVGTSSEDRGRAEGLALALAIFRNSYAPDLDAEREAAMRRWASLNPPGDGREGE